jgi:hypothetical protein
MSAQDDDPAYPCIDMDMNRTHITFVNTHFKPFTDSLHWPLGELKAKPHDPSRSRLASLAKRYNRNDVLDAMSKSDAGEYHHEKLLEDISVIDINAARFMLENLDIECVNIHSLTRIGKRPEPIMARLSAIKLIVSHFNIRANRIISAGIIEALDDGQDTTTCIQICCNLEYWLPQIAKIIAEYGSNDIVAWLKAHCIATAER